MTFSHQTDHSFNTTVLHHLDYPFRHRQDSTVKSILFPPPPAPRCSSFSRDILMKRDPGGIGFLDEVGGRVDGLMSCTESLGFESSDERRVDDKIFEMCDLREDSSTFSGGISKWKREHVRTEAKKFPPPLSSLDHNGKPTFFLRPVRKDGKLELQEVRINRPEVLCASRQDGRLTLHLVCSDDEDEEEDLDFEEAYDEGEENEEEIEEDVHEIIENKAEEEPVEEEGWRMPVSPSGGSGGGDCFRRCHEMVYRHRNHHHRPHYDFHVWNRHCVTIR